MLKKLRKTEYNWTGKYIKEYNDMVAHYEKIISEKNTIIDKLNRENRKLREGSSFVAKQKQISDKDINRIRKMKDEGKTYSFISKETGWSKATISRVINNRKQIY